MLQTIDDYLDHVAKMHGGASDREIGRLLKIKGHAVSQWRTRRTWPNENNMVALCKLGNLDTTRGLIMLAQWRSEGEAQGLWQSIAAKLALVSVLAALLLTPVDRAQAATRLELNVAPSVYYGYWRRFLRRLFVWLFASLETNRCAHVR